jgi:hypothetical protein
MKYIESSGTNLILVHTGPVYTYFMRNSVRTFSTSKKDIASIKTGKEKSVPEWVYSA